MDFSPALVPRTIHVRVAYSPLLVRRIAPFQEGVAVPGGRR